MMRMRRQFLPYASFEGAGTSPPTVSTGARRVFGSRILLRTQAMLTDLLRGCVN
jgi:hypothetical protein